MFRFSAFAAACLPLLLGAGPAAASGIDQLLSIYGGRAEVSDGYEAREFVGAFVEINHGQVAFHAEAAGVSREDDAVFGALGLSWQASPSLRPKIMVGTSSSHQMILPEEFASLSVQMKPQSMPGWIVTPAVVYRSYESGGSEVRPAIDLVRYLKPSSPDGYWVLQGNAAVSFNSSDENGYSLGLGAQTVRASGLTMGLSGEVGRMTYDSLLGIGVASDIWAARPSVGFRFDPTREIYLRGEYAHTDFYDVRSAMVGVKLGL